jgi:hypothetical protein
MKFNKILLIYIIIFNIGNLLFLWYILSFSSEASRIWMTIHPVFEMIAMVGFIITGIKIKHL